jgi:pyruvyltransferase
MMHPIQAFWWANTPNFGDGISQLVMSRVSGRAVELASPMDAEIFGIGSIMKAVRQGALGRRGDRKPWVWGSGVMSAMGKDFTKSVRFAAVRGPLTIERLGLPIDTPVGDPGLLAAELLDDQPERRAKIGVLLHFSQRMPRDLAKRLNKDGRFVRIRADWPNCVDVVRSIASCSHIMSSSLHGLIVADSLRVPSTWLEGYDIHADPTFKFHDYAMSVERDIGTPKPLQSIFDHAESLALSAAPLPHESGIARRTEDIRAAFPDELRGGRA